jgi:hypothetical protein
MMASAAGAVLAAVIASFFGVKGTIVGVAIGSVAATMGTALVAQSIDRTHEVVKQVVVRVPDRTTLLRRLGGTRASGADSSPPEGDPALVEGSTSNAVHSGAEMPTVPVEAAAAPETALMPVPVGSASTPQPASGGRRLRWPVIAGIVAAVFVGSLLLVTAVEFIAGRPLADLFNSHAGGGTTVEKIFQTPSTTLPSPTSTTTTSSSTSTTSSTSSTTTPTVVGGTTTSTLPGLVGGSTTSTPGTGPTGTTSTTLLP